MRKIVLFLFAAFGLITLHAQDYLSTPQSNPALFSKYSNKISIDKAFDSPRDSVIYKFDTLSLPFLDDFSRNHFYKNVDRLPSTSYTDTTFYKIYSGGNLYKGTEGFVVDSTYTYKYNANDSLISTTLNFLGQLDVYDLSSYPIYLEFVSYFKPYTIRDTLNGGKDTIFKTPTLFQDSANYYFVQADTTVFYTDRSVYRNNTFPILPPSIGVATFDGLDKNGLPYDINNQLTVKADYLTSVPLWMGNLPDTDVYISFFVEPKGISIDKVEKGDSLALDFYDVIKDKWGTIWAIDGYQADTFTQHIVKVPARYFQDGTQFRFRNYANSSGAFDQWHLDYIYLDASRTPKDTTYRDVAYVYEPRSLLKDWHAMPYWHFQMDPSKYMIDSSDVILVKNNDDNGASVYNKVTINDTVGNSIFYRYPTVPQLSIISSFENYKFKYPINFDYAPSDIDSAGIFKAEYTIKIGTQNTKDFIPTNDTAYSKAILDNYYAYDDGTAEAGYGVNPQVSGSGLMSYIALEIDQPQPDSIGGLQIYFLPQIRDIRKQVFRIKVWRGAQNAGPGDVLYSQEMLVNPIYTNNNGFVTFWFDSLMEVPQRYYVGIEAVGKFSMNIGYDLNTNHKDKIFWGFNGSDWFNPSASIFDGSLMMRPIYKKYKWKVGLKEHNLKKEDFVVFPNPNDGRFSIAINGDLQIKNIQLFDLNGRLVYDAPFTENIEVAELAKGMYFLRITVEDGRSISKKIIVN